MKSLEEVHESSQSQLVSGKAKKWFHPGSNRGPSLRESDVITNYTMKPSTRVAKSLSHEEVKKKSGEKRVVSQRRKKGVESEKNGSTQNRTGVLRTRISYAAPTPWNLSRWTAASTFDAREDFSLSKNKGHNRN